MEMVINKKKRKNFPITIIKGINFNYGYGNGFSYSKFEFKRKIPEIMIKIYGLNREKGSGDYCLFGNFLNGDGNGNGESSYLFYYNSYLGNGSGDGESWSYHYLKEEFQK